MSTELDERELYSVFKASPLLTEATKIILESAGASVQVIADRLHKKPPTIYRALQKLDELKLASTHRQGRSVIYTVERDKMEVIFGILDRLYRPTVSYVIGELLSEPFDDASVERGVEVDGVAVDHPFDVFIESHHGKKSKRVAVDVFTDLTQEALYGLLGWIASVKGISAYLVLVVEYGTAREKFRKIEKFVNDMKGKLNVPTTVLLIERDNPQAGINRARQFVNSALGS